MASVSTVPTAKAGILALIQARAGLSDLQAAGAITWSHPGKDIAKEAIFMGAAVFTSEEVAGMRRAPHAHNELYTVPVWVDVLYEANDGQAAELRMWTLVGEVEQALRDDPGLGAGPDGGILRALVTGKVPEEYISDQGWGVRCKVNVEVLGRSQ